MSPREAPEWWKLPMPTTSFHLKKAVECQSSLRFSLSNDNLLQGKRKYSLLSTNNRKNVRNFSNPRVKIPNPGFLLVAEDPNCQEACPRGHRRPPCSLPNAAPSLSTVASLRIPEPNPSISVNTITFDEYYPIGKKNTEYTHSPNHRHGVRWYSNSIDWQLP